jgi:hypothetical protein
MQYHHMLYVMFRPRRAIFMAFLDLQIATVNYKISLSINCSSLCFTLMNGSNVIRVVAKKYSVLNLFIIERRLF